MSGTTVPAILNALYTLASSVAPSDTTVIDGPDSDRGQLGDYICVGATGQGPCVVNAETITDYGLASPTETIDVISEAVAWQADIDFAACRGRAKTLVDGIAAGVRKDPTLGGVAMLAQWFGTEWTQLIQAGKGGFVVAQFTIRVQAAKQ